MRRKLAPIAMLAAILCTAPHLLADPLLPACNGSAAVLRAAYGLNAEDRAIGFLQTFCWSGESAQNRARLALTDSLNDRGGTRPANQPELTFPVGDFVRVIFPDVQLGYSSREHGFLAAQNLPSTLAFTGQSNLYSNGFGSFGLPFFSGLSGWFASESGKEQFAGTSAQTVEFTFKTHPGVSALTSYSGTTSVPRQRVPEPGTLVLLSMGLAAVGISSYRGRRAEEKK